MLHKPRKKHYEKRLQNEIEKLFLGFSPLPESEDVLNKELNQLPAEK